MTSPTEIRFVPPNRWILAISLLLPAFGCLAAEPAPSVAAGAALDVHTHLASQAFTDFMTGGGVPAADGKDLVERLDEAHVDRAVVLSAGYFAVLDGTNMAPENDYVAQQIGKFPDRLIGFCGINPLFEDATREVDRCLALPGMIGVKLHLEGSGLDLTDDAHVAALSAVFDRIQKHRAPVLLHASDPYGLPLEGVGLANLAWILQEHPRTRVAHAHCAGNADDQSIELWLRVGGSGFSEETSYVDVSACLAFFRDAPLATRELMVWRLRKWGIARVLFGSDYFRYGEDETPAQALDTLSRYPFTQQELKTILDNDGSTWLGRHAGASAGRGR